MEAVMRRIRARSLRIIRPPPAANFQSDLLSLRPLGLDNETEEAAP
jgi:hypothetical protein